jgi:hypothetical protein
MVSERVMEMSIDAPNGRQGWATNNPAGAIRNLLREHPAADPYYQAIGWWPTPLNLTDGNDT